MKKTRYTMSEINVVPYIDVMLVLLIIFMITAPLLSQGIKVNLPQATAKPLSTQDQQPIVITVDQFGHYYLNISKTSGIPIDPRSLMIEVQKAVSYRQERTVLVKGDKAASYGTIVNVMVLLQKAGIDKIGLMTEHVNNDSDADKNKN